jgi:hypothetical protein
MQLSKEYVRERKTVNNQSIDVFNLQVNMHDKEKSFKSCLPEEEFELCISNLICVICILFEG